MGTASTLINTAIAEPPVSFITRNALPEALIGGRLTDVAEESRL